MKGINGLKKAETLVWKIFRGFSKYLADSDWLLVY